MRLLLLPKCRYKLFAALIFEKGKISRNLAKRHRSIKHVAQSQQAGRRLEFTFQANIDVQSAQPVETFIHKPLAKLAIAGSLHGTTEAAPALKSTSSDSRTAIAALRPLRNAAVLDIAAAGSYDDLNAAED
jgi:hypothetical protein